MDACGVGKGHLVQLPELILYCPAVEFNLQQPLFDVNLGNLTDVTVEDLLVIVVDGLDNLVAGGKGGPEPSNLRLALFI